MEFRKKTAVALAAAASLGAMAVAVTSPAAAQRGNAPQAGQKIADSYICVFKPGMGAAEVHASAMGTINGQGGQVKHIYTNAIQGFATRASAAAVQNMRRSNPRIAFCEQDSVVTTVQLRENKKGGNGNGKCPNCAPTPSPTPSPTPTPTPTPPPTGGTQDTPYGITRIGGGVSGAQGTAWVLDTGVDASHPDLNVDGSRSVDFTGSSSGWSDVRGHGTHVAGTIAAIDNDFGVIGVAAGATVVSVKVLNDSGSGTISGVIAGVDYVAANGSANDVANMSLGGGASTSLDQAVINASATLPFSLAAGNESTFAGNRSPARAEGPNIFTISAIDINDVFASFSNYGNPPVDWAAPGVSVLSTVPGGGYASYSGTSMAAPHFAGLLLLGGFGESGFAVNDPDGNSDPIASR